MKHFQNNSLYDADIKIIKQSEHCTVYEMKNDEETGIMTSYQVFPGIMLMYKDFHMGKCPHHSRLHKDIKEILEINHCREGRFECEIINGMSTYLSEGDLAINTIVNNRVINSTFPRDMHYGLKGTGKFAGIFIADVTGNNRDAILTLQQHGGCCLHAIRSHISINGYSVNRFKTRIHGSEGYIKPFR